MAYKTVLVAVVIGILTISSLWVFVIQQADNPATATMVTDPDNQVHEDTAAKRTKIELLEDQYEIIDRTLASVGRIVVEDGGNKLQGSLINSSKMGQLTCFLSSDMEPGPVTLQVVQKHLQSGQDYSVLSSW